MYRKLLELSSVYVSAYNAFGFVLEFFSPTLLTAFSWVLYSLGYFRSVYVGGYTETTLGQYGKDVSVSPNWETDEVQTKI